MLVRAAFAVLRRILDRPTWHNSAPPVQRHTLLHCCLSSQKAARGRKKKFQGFQGREGQRGSRERMMGLTKNESPSELMKRPTRETNAAGGSGTRVERPPYLRTVLQGRFDLGTRRVSPSTIGCMIRQATCRTLRVSRRTPPQGRGALVARSHAARVEQIVRTIQSVCKRDRLPTLRNPRLPRLNPRPRSRTRARTTSQKPVQAVRRGCEKTTPKALTSLSYIWLKKPR